MINILAVSFEFKNESCFIHFRHRFLSGTVSDGWMGRSHCCQCGRFHLSCLRFVSSQLHSVSTFRKSNDNACVIRSCKAIDSEEKDDDTQWLTYWVVFAFFSVVESITDLLMFWVPFYFLFKVS